MQVRSNKFIIVKSLRILYLFLYLLIFILLSCDNKNKITKNKINWFELVKEYSEPKDSLKLQALEFLKENMDDLSSEKVIYFDRNIGDPVNLNFLDFNSDSTFKQYLKENNIEHKSVYVPDYEIINNEFLKQRIENAFSVWKVYPWNKNVSFDNFLNYLLPYKIVDEYPDEWAPRLQKMFSEDVSKYVKMGREGNDTLRDLYKQANELYYSFNVNRIGELFSYSSQSKYLSKRAGFNEISLLKNGDCYGGAYLGVYYLRSIGIPATVDYVQYWGSKNGSHATEVFINEFGKMTAASGRGLAGAAKVFRLTFRKNNVWKDSISPIVDSNSFVLKNLQNNHWIDVTASHTNTKNIKLKINGKLEMDTKYGYICVFNYGEWLPIFWGKVKDNITLTFENMGYPMLYRIALPNGGKYKLVGPTYKIDSNGNISVNKPNNSSTKIVCEKINSGGESWVKKGKLYDLLVLDESSKWIKKSSAMCGKDSLVSFENIPKNAIYRLVQRGDFSELPRPFTYERNKQIWW